MIFFTYLFVCLFNVYGCVTSMFVCVPHMYSAGCGQKRVFDPLRPELEAAVNHHVGARMMKQLGICQILWFAFFEQVVNVINSSSLHPYVPVQWKSSQFS